MEALPAPKDERPLPPPGGGAGCHLGSTSGHVAVPAGGVAGLEAVPEEIPAGDAAGEAGDHDVVDRRLDQVRVGRRPSATRTWICMVEVSAT